MMIKYNGTNVHAMAQVNQAQGALVQTPQDVQWLRPGWNEFPKAVWEQNKNHPQHVKMIKKGMIEFLAIPALVPVRDAKTGKIKKVKRVVGADDRPVKLKYLDEKLAIKIVLSTLNRDILERWLDEEQRHKVKKVLRKQIKPLLSTSSEDDEDGGEDVDEEEFE